jgi:hypothetical protein
MPYKDPERKREYQKDYRARLREAKARAQSPPARRVYFCSRYPSLKIGNSIKFVDSFFVTSCPEQQRLIESFEGYGSFICSWPADPGPDKGSQDFIL